MESGRLDIPRSVWWFRRRRRTQSRWERTCWCALESPMCPSYFASLSPRSFYSSSRTHLNTSSSDAFSCWLIRCHPHRHFLFATFPFNWFFFKECFCVFLFVSLISLDFRVSLKGRVCVHLRRARLLSNWLNIHRPLFMNVQHIELSVDGFCGRFLGRLHLSGGWWTSSLDSLRLLSNGI